MPTNAVYGFTRTLQKILQEHEPDYIAVSFDLVGPTFRHAQYGEYKAHRPGMPQDLVVQLPLIRESLEAFNIPVLEMPGFEADDIMGTMVTKAKAEGLRSTIVTSDKDMLQFVDESVRVMSPAKEALVYDEAAVKEKFGVKPAQITQILALMGDSADNIPGVPGLGPKTAARLVQEFGDIEGVYKNLDKNKSETLRENLRSHRQRVMENLDLVCVRTDVPVTATLGDCRVRSANKERLLDLWKRLEFGALMREVMDVQAPSETKTAVIVQDASEFARRMKELANADEFVFDLVTTSPHPTQAEILGAVFHVASEGEVFYVTLGAGISSKDFLTKTKPIFENDRIRKTGHDLKYDAVVLLQHGIALGGIAFDTMLASYLLNPSKIHHGISDLSVEFLNERIQTVAELLGTGKTARTMAEIPAQELATYACAEGRVIARLRSVLMPLLASKQLQGLFQDVEIPLEIVLSKMEHAGIAVDQDILRDLSKEFEIQIEQITRDIHRIAGEEFNIASTKELARILFEKLKLTAHRKTKTGFSTDVDVLTQLAKAHELPALVLAYRTLCKLKSTYSDALPGLVNPATGRIHTSFNQTVAATGRLSSSEPNLQNIPIKTPMGLRIRSAFVPSAAGMVLLGADYSQIELRILAHFSGDENLLEAFRKDMDVHSYTAGLVFGLDPQEVGADQRRKAKIVNFGILYGMGAFSLAKEMGVAVAEAQQFIDAYFARYKGVQEFIARVLAKAHQEKCVTTILGRRRYLPDISSSNFNLRQFAERTAINTVVQGSAADIIKMAMLQVDAELTRGKCKASMLLQIHDELVFEVRKAEADGLAKLVRDKMENVVALAVPLKVDVKKGNNWAQL